MGQNGFFRPNFCSICDDPENFFLMPAPLNNRFSIQSRQNFKIEFCVVAWDRAVFFVDKALEMQRKYGRF